MPPVRRFRVLDPDFPWRLRELDHPPDCVWVHGEFAGTPAVAIVGTRQPSPAAVAYTTDLAFRLGKAGASVWSGGAFGIDAAAHRGALAAGARTIVVMGTGSEFCFPSEHAALFDSILDAHGALVYPFPPEQPPTSRTFLQRNSVLAALIDVMIVVQAPFRSGARSAAARARKLGRPVYVVPSWPWDSLGSGNLEELKCGASLLADERVLAQQLGIELAPRTIQEPPSGTPRRGPRAHAARRANAATPATQAEGQAPTIGKTILEHEIERGEGSNVIGGVTTDRSEMRDGLPCTPKRGIGAAACLLGGPLSIACRTVLDATGATPRHFDVLCETTGLAPPLLQEALLTLTIHDVLVEGPSGFYRRINH